MTASYQWEVGRTDAILAHKQGSINYAVSDSLGTVYANVGEAGGIEWRGSYDVYGDPRGAITNGLWTPIGFHRSRA
jgi:hypothetical protein